MAKSTQDEPVATDTPSTEPAQDVSAQPAAEPTDLPAVPAADGCVVDDGTPHMGRPVHGGKVCSAHEMHYRSDGTRRVPLESSAITTVAGPRLR
jgi:hypothetical protein